MRSIARIFLYASWLWASTASALAAEADAFPPSSSSRVPESQPRTLENAAEAAAGIRTGYAGHYACSTFTGLNKELCVAASDEEPEEVGRLIAAGADIDARSTGSHTKGMTILQVAVWHGWSLRAIELLVNAGADVNAVDDRGDSALICATQNWPVADSALVGLLIRSGGDVNAKGEKGMTALMHASMHDPTAQVVKSLAEAGADVSARDATGWTALMHATRKNDGRAKVVEFLIGAGSDVNAAHNHGGTALSIASYSDHVEAVRLLIEAGANVNARDQAGWTPLICASVGGHDQVVKLLIEAGADVSRKDRLGRTARSVAVGNGHTETARLLAEAGAQ